MHEIRNNLTKKACLEFILKMPKKVKPTNVKS